MKLGLILVGILMLIYLIGAYLVGGLGFAVVLGDITGFATKMPRVAAINMWTWIYMIADFFVFAFGIFWPGGEKH